MNAPSVKILACPFCGAEPLLQEFPAHEHVLATFMPDHEGSWAIECPGCGVGICTDTEENALAIWNSRAPSSSEAELLAERARRIKAETQLRDTAMIIKRLAYMLGDSVTRQQALDWLKRNELEGSPLRAQYPRVEKESDNGA